MYMMVAQITVQSRFLALAAFVSEVGGANDHDGGSAGEL